MLNDVTFGQYYPTRSFVHNMDPRAKLILVIAYIVAIFLADNFFGLAAVILFLLITVAFARVPLGRVLRSVKMILFVIIFTAILNLFFYSAGEDAHMIWEWRFLSLSWESVINTIFLAMRLFLLVMGTSVLTLTATPVALTDGIESSGGSMIGLAGGYIDLDISLVSEGETYVGDDGLTRKNITVEMTNQIVGTTGYNTVYQIDESLPAGSTKVKTTPYTGYTVKVYRNLYAGGALQETRLESTSVYRARDKVVLVSPADAAQYGL